MSQLPLNIPYLLTRLRPGASYVMNGRSYGDIVWLDDKEEIPTLLELENEFIRIQALEGEHQNRTDLLEAEAARSAHEKNERAKGSADAFIKETHRLLSNEITRLNIEVAKERSIKLAEIEEDRKRLLAKLEDDVRAKREFMAEQLGVAHNKLCELEGERVYKQLVVTKKRASEFPTKEEMIEAIRKGRPAIKALAKRMGSGKKKK